MTDDLEKQLTEEKRIQTASLTRSDYLSTGSTLLNLALSGFPYGGFIKGAYHWIVGDSDTGKSFLAYTGFAEAANDGYWDGYDLIENQIEGGALMDKTEFFGSRAASRIQPPDYYPDGSPKFAESVDDLYFSIDSRLDEVLAGKRKPFIEVVDSIDALTSKYEMARFDMRRTAHEDGKEAKGDYTDGKAKVHSQNLRRIRQKLRRTGCTLIFISQTRDNVDAGMFEAKSVVSGGRALKFYAIWQLWSSPGGKITKTFRGIERQLGIYAKIKIRKNHLTGKNWELTLPIYHAHGIDNAESCCQYLVDEKHWKKTGSKITAPEFDFEGSLEKLVVKINDEDLEPILVKIVTKVWRETGEKIRPKRRRRYQ